MKLKIDMQTNVTKLQSFSFNIQKMVKKLLENEKLKKLISPQN